jgi:hypothetical protein
MPRREERVRVLLAGMILGTLICLGLLLRWQYAVSASPFWDEFITLWSARNVIDDPFSAFQWGVGADAPLFRGLEALLLKLLGFDITVARTLGIAISVITIPLTFYVGKRMFSVPAGLLASALMAFVPQIVIEGARARPYPLFLLLTLLSLLFFYRWMIETDSGYQVPRAASWPFLICFVAAIFTHLEAILLLPGFALSAVVRWSPGVLARNRILLVFLICAMGGALALVSFVQSESVPGSIPLGEGVWAGSAHIDLGPKNIEVFGKLFRRTPGGLALLSVAVSGMTYSVAWTSRMKLRGRASKPSQAIGEEEPKDLLSASSRERQNHGLVFLSVLLLWTIGAIIFLLGARWGSETRYILFVFPAFSLVVGATVVRFLSFLAERARISGEATRQWVVFGLVAVGMGLIGVPSIIDTQRFGQEWGYDLAFEYVADRWREGDVTVTIAPMACLVTLEQCDYIAIQWAYETYAIEKNGGLVEAVTKLPLILTVQEMEKVLDEHERVWFVTDEGRLLSRYEPDFVQLIWDRMKLVANERGGLVFRSLDQEQPAIQRVLDWNLEDRFRLRGCDLDQGTFTSGDELELTLYWQGVEYANYFGLDYSVFVHLVDREDNVWAQSDGYPVGGLYPTSHWSSTEVVIPDRRGILLPPGIPTDRYRLEVGMYLLQTGDRLEVWDESGDRVGDRIIVDYVEVGDLYEDQLTPANPLSVNLGDSVRILGYDLGGGTVEPEESISLALYWQALVNMQKDYTVFVHLVGEDGQIISQHDGQPDGGFYLTSYWDQGVVVKDEHVLSLPSEIEAGQYELRVGMYLLEDMYRLPVAGGAGEDWVVLTRIQLGDNTRVGKDSGAR